MKYPELKRICSEKCIHCHVSTIHQNVHLGWHDRENIDDLFTVCETWATHTLVNIIPVIEREMFYLTTHSTHFIYGYMASDIWLRTLLIVRQKTRCCHIGYSYWLTANVLLYAPSHRQDNTYHGLCYTSREALAGTRNSFPVIIRGSVKSYNCCRDQCMIVQFF